MRALLVIGAAAALLGPGAAQAELAVPGIHEAMLVTAPGGRPIVAYTRGSALFVSSRSSAGHWRARRALALPGRRARVVGLAERRGRVLALVEGRNRRWLGLAVRSSGRWSWTPLVAHLRGRRALGTAGLAVDHGGRAIVAYTIWRSETGLSSLLLAYCNPNGGVETERVTLNGFPPSYVPPPAAPVVMPGGAVHVLESWGTIGSITTIEWIPVRSSWIGQVLDAGTNDFPIGRLITAVGRRGTVYVAWTEVSLAAEDTDVFFAARGHYITTYLLFDQALLTGFILTPRGPEAAGNIWVAPPDLGLEGNELLYAGQVTGPAGRVEFDARVEAFARGPRGSRQLLLDGERGLSWFRTPGPLTPRVQLDADPQDDGTVLLRGRVGRFLGGTVKIYRERPGTRRQLAAMVPVAPDGSFSATDLPPQRPLVYRAVYVDPLSGLPYARLLRDPVF